MMIQVGDAVNKLGSRNLSTGSKVGSGKGTTSRLFPRYGPSRSIDRLLSGDLALLFWGAAVALGLIVPLALTAMQAFGKQPQAKGGTAVLSRPSVLFVGLVCLVAGSVAIRSIMYLLGSSVQSFIY